MSKSSAVRDEIKRILYYQTRPIEWAERYLGIRRNTIVWGENPGYENHTWDGTPNPLAEMANSVARRIKRIVATSAVGTGKTFELGWLPLYWLDCFRPSRVITFGPKEDQLRMNLWKEVGQHMPRFRELHPQVQLMDLQLRMRPEADSKLEWGMFGYPAGAGAEEMAASRAQGFHDPHLLIILEETPGIHPAVINALVTTLVGPHNILLAVGNPNSDTDPLAKLSESRRSKVIRISALDHPNYVLNNPLFINGACTRESVEEILEDRAGGDIQHPMYESRARGIIPKIAATSLFSPTMMRKAEKLLVPPIEEITHDNKERGIEGVTHIYFRRTEDYLGQYVFFMDPAGASGTGDWHAAVMWNRVLGRPDAIVRMRGLVTDFIEACFQVLIKYEVPGNRKQEASPLLVWETNGVGAHFHHIDQRLPDYRNVYFRRNIEAAGATPRKTYGYNAGGRSRDKMVFQLEEWNRELSYYPERMVSRLVYDEARTFVQQKQGGKETYAAQSGYYDDVITALGNARLLASTLPAPLKIEKIETEKPRILHPRLREVIKYNERQKDPFNVPMEKLMI